MRGRPLTPRLTKGNERDKAKPCIQKMRYLSLRFQKAIPLPSIDLQKKKTTSDSVFAEEPRLVHQTLRICIELYLCP